MIGPAGITRHASKPGLGGRGHETASLGYEMALFLPGGSRMLKRSQAPLGGPADPLATKTIRAMSAAANCLLSSAALVTVCLGALACAAEEKSAASALILNRMLFDGEQLAELLAPLDLGWRARTEEESALMADLVPLLKKRAGGLDISGLRAYEE